MVDSSEIRREKTHLGFVQNLENSHGIFSTYQLISKISEVSTVSTDITLKTTNPQKKFTWTEKHPPVAAGDRLFEKKNAAFYR